MRASCVGWAARNLEEAERLGAITAMPTHSHPQGICGAKVFAGLIFLLRSGASKEQAANYARKFYDISFTLDEIRDDYRFDVSCAGTVPQAIVAFLEGSDFVDVISGAISIGGDSDTLAVIARSLAEAIYPIPHDLQYQVCNLLPTELLRKIIDTSFSCAARKKVVLSACLNQKRRTKLMNYADNLNNFL